MIEEADLEEEPSQEEEKKRTSVTKNSGVDRPKPKLNKSGVQVNPRPNDFVGSKANQ